MNLKMYFLTVLCMPLLSYSMEEQTCFQHDPLPDKLKFQIAASIQGASFTDTIKEIMNLRLVNRSWNNSASDRQMLKFIISQYKEKDQNNHESYSANLEKIRTILDGRKPESGLDNTSKQEIKRLKSATFYSELVSAARLGRLPLVQLLLENDPDSLQVKLPDAQAAINQAFIVAVKYNQSEVVRYLLAHGADLDSCDLQNRLATFIALKKNHKTIQEILREHRAHKHNNTQE